MFHVKPAQIDVELEIPYGEILDQIGTTADKNVVATIVVERCRHEALRLAEEAGGSLNMARPPEFYIRRGSHVTFGGDFMLVASRWWCEMPNDFDPQRAAAMTR